MTLLSHLNTLESAGLIRLIMVQPELEYLFRHALVQDAAYGSLLRQDRRQLHLEVGEALERIHTSNLDEVAATLALHFERAEVHDKATYYLTRAGERAKAAYANREAITFFRSAIHQLEHLLRSGTEGPGVWEGQLPYLHENIGDLLELTGQHEEAMVNYLRALSLVSADGPVGQPRLHRKMGYAWMIQRRHEESIRAYQRAETSLGHEPAGPAPAWWQEWLEIQLECIWLRYTRNDVAELTRLVERARPAMEQFGTMSQRSKFYFGLMNLACRQNRYSVSEEMLAIGRAGLDAAQASDNLNILAEAYFMLGNCYQLYGDLHESEAHLQAGLTLAEQTGNVILQSRSLTYLTVALRRLGLIPEVRACITKVLAVVTEGQMKEYLATAKANLAWVAWREGDLFEAREQSQTAIQIWQQTPLVYPFQWTALWPLIGVETVEGRISEAIKYSQALLTPTQQRMPNVLTEILERAIRTQAQGRSGEARELLDRAVGLARESGYL